ncbi:unnamed protein product [Zymoseptoria tritici ST99CH_3D1]|nr:unnamed protein product [Zymoseptoria tritici ST99CH_3D1]
MNVSLPFLVGTSALLKASNALAVRNPDSPEEVELSEEALAKMTMSEFEELVDEKREELIGQAAMTEAILTKLDGTEENAAEAIEIATKQLSGVLQAGNDKLVESAQANLIATNQSLFDDRASHDVFVREVSRVERDASVLLQLQHDQIVERRLLHREDRKIYREYYRAMTRTEDIASCFIQRQHDRFIEYAIQMGRTEKEASCLLQEQRNQLQENAIEISRTEQAIRDQLQLGQDEFHGYAAEMGRTEKEASCLLQEQHNKLREKEIEMSRVEQAFRDQLQHGQDEFSEYAAEMRDTEQEASCLLQKQHNELREKEIEIDRVEEASRGELQREKDVFREYASEMSRVEKVASCHMQRQYDANAELSTQVTDLRQRIQIQREVHQERSRKLRLGRTKLIRKQTKDLRGKYLTIGNITRQRDQVQAALGIAEGRVASRDKDLEAKDVELGELRDKLKGKEQELVGKEQELQQKSGLWESERQSLREDKRQAEEGRDRMGRDLEEKKATIARQNQEKIDMMENHETELQDERRKLPEHYDELLGEAYDRLQELKASEAGLKTELELKTTRLQESGRKLETQGADLTRATDRATEVEQEMRDHVAEHAKVAAELVATKKSAEDADKVSVELTAKLQDMELSHDAALDRSNLRFKGLCRQTIAERERSSRTAAGHRAERQGLAAKLEEASLRFTLICIVV